MPNNDDKQIGRVVAMIFAAGLVAVFIAIVVKLIRWIIGF